MQNDYKVYLDDILEAIGKIENYTKNISFSEFSGSDIVVDAVARNLEIIGEAVKNLPNNLKIKYPNIEWKKIAGLRDMLIHEYSGIDLKILWDVVQNKLSILKKSISKIITNVDD